MNEWSLKQIAESVAFSSTSPVQQMMTVSLDSNSNLRQSEDTHMGKGNWIQQIFPVQRNKETCTVSLGMCLSKLCVLEAMWISLGSCE